MGGVIPYARVDRVFFFSSRRRHTRCLSDWSSDVCSSDLSVFCFLLSLEPPSNGRCAGQLCPAPMSSPCTPSTSSMQPMCPITATYVPTSQISVTNFSVSGCQLFSISPDCPPISAFYFQRFCFSQIGGAS